MKTLHKIQESIKRLKQINEAEDEVLRELEVRVANLNTDQLFAKVDSLEERLFELKMELKSIKDGNYRELSDLD